MPVHPIGSKEWREEFAKTRDSFLDSLRSAVSSCSEVLCKPCTDDFTFGWTLEEGHTKHPRQREGDLEFGIAYLGHMYDQGFHVGFGVVIEHGRATVYLKAWEHPQDEPRWPSGFVPAIARYRARTA